MTEKSRILVVDDHPDVRLLVCIALRPDSSLSVAEADGGIDGLTKIAEQRPDLLILDLMMPDVDGFEVCRRLRADPGTAALPILMLTALADASSKSRGLLAGADDFLVKPFRNDDLRARVRSLLNRPRATRDEMPERH